MQYSFKVEIETDDSFDITQESVECALEHAIERYMINVYFRVTLLHKKVIARCTSKKSEDGGSTGKRIACDGVLYINGEGDYGCGEPCHFIMHPKDYEVKE